MQDLKRDGEKKQVETELEIFLLTEMGFLSSLKRKQIKFNPRPFVTQVTTNDDQEETTDDNIIDFHLEITRKIDEVIEKHERELEQQKSFEEEQPEIIELRKPWMKKPDMPEFKTDITSISTENNLEIEEELFELEIPQDTKFTPTLNNQNNVPFQQQEPVENIEKELLDHSVLTGGEDTPSDLLTGLGRIKVRKSPSNSTQKSKKIQNRNGYTIAKKDLDTVKSELERKKQELEQIEKITKEKEEELKRKKHERKEKEKQRKLELKKRAKMEKIKQREMKKLEKQREIEKLKKERLRQIESKKLEKQKEIEKLEKEKLEKIEAKRLLKEKKLKEKQQVEKEKKQKIEEKKKKPIGKPTSPIKPSIRPEPKKEIQKTDDFDEEVKQALEIIDELLGKLPEETIDEFAQSDDFALYEKVVKKYKSK